MKKNNSGMILIITVISFIIYNLSLNYIFGFFKAYSIHNQIIWVKYGLIYQGLTDYLFFINIFNIILILIFIISLGGLVSDCTKKRWIKNKDYKQRKTKGWIMEKINITLCTRNWRLSWLSYILITLDYIIENEIFTLWLWCFIL